uniref:Glutathione S-transferase zeta class-like n=1 Tax=Cicer arietinum TaxID=3827 RepID=A0A3Q7Y6V9_CICAR|nr:glutathione S-transferase zeta class-like [Cicer arietinum]
MDYYESKWNLKHGKLVWRILKQNIHASCSFRFRIALNVKGLEYEYKAVNLLKGEQSHPEFLQLNPIGFVPVLVDGPAVIFYSFAIIKVTLNPFFYFSNY